MVDLFTETMGLVTLAARSARRSSRRFSCLEPIHLLAVTFDLPRGASVGTLLSAEIDRARVGATASMRKLEAATVALGWLRKVARSHQAEYGAWEATNAFLDAIAGHSGADASGIATWQAAYGLHLLAAAGWEPNLESCVRCGTACPLGSSVTVVPAIGGISCRACGSGALHIAGPLRTRVLETFTGCNALELGDAPAVSTLVKAMLAVHVESAL
jgi:DNA repair protein RecO (recombination protein O)